MLRDRAAGSPAGPAPELTDGSRELRFRARAGGFFGREIMRRLLYATAVLVLISHLFATRTSAENAVPLQAVVRFYPDWKADPRGYVTLAVPLQDFEIRADAVRTAYTRSQPGDDGARPQDLREAILVAVPDDQQDPAVVEAMGGLVFARFYGRDPLVLRSDAAPRNPPKPCLFLDALGQPLPNAAVEILIGQGDSLSSMPTPRVWIADAQLDAEGRLQPPWSISSLNHFGYQVMHPDCGLVPALPQYASDNGPCRVFRVGALPRDRWCTFLDALGYPLAGAQVEVITSGRWEDGRMTSLPPILLDGAGRLQPPPTFTTLAHCSLLVSDLNYGIALVEPYSMTELSVREPLSWCVVPLIAGGTPADAGSVWGAVVDRDGTPIPSAVIRCSRLLLPSGESLAPYWPWPAQWNKEVKVLTNDRGRFALCLPLAQEDGMLGRRVPPGAAYEVTVTPPEELGYQGTQARLPAGHEYIITLQGTANGPKKYSGTLLFEDQDGLVTDPEKISRVDVMIRVRRAGSPALTYAYLRGEWLEKSVLPFGTYEARVDWDGKHYTFRPMVVRAESPATIVFKPWRIERFEARYCGRVINGANGDPIAGAVVLSSSSSNPRPNSAGRGFDSRSDASKHPEQPGSGAGMQTNPAGRFELVLPVAAGAGPDRTFVALKKDYFDFPPSQSPVGSDRGERKSRGRALPIDKSGKATVPDLKLFPVGTVTIEPNVPAGYRSRRIRLDVLTADPASWLKDLRFPSENKAEEDVLSRCSRDLTSRGRQSLYVPAYVTLTLRLQLPGEQYAPVFIEDVLVGQGKTVDVGRVDFAPTVPVAVKVIDSAGDPVAGITVKSLADKCHYPGFGAATDTTGVAHLPVAAHFSGRAFVEYQDPRTNTTAREAVPCRIAGPEDAGREFVLQLSDTFPEQLPKSE
jgi:hypothetical protein